MNIGEEFWLKQIGPEVSRGIKNIANYQTLGGFISLILPNVFLLTGIILFILLIFGGIMIISSAGQQNPEGMAKGQKAITNALVGFLIIFLSYWIIQIISAVTGLNILRPGL